MGGRCLTAVGFIVLAVSIATFFCLSTVHPPRKEIAVLSLSVCTYPPSSSSQLRVLPVSPLTPVRNVGYCFHTAGASCGSAAIYCPLTFSVTYGVSRGFSQGLANYSYATFHPAEGR
jgi:hypothetical protein